jgi:hypothetical protein
MWEMCACVMVVWCDDTRVAISRCSKSPVEAVVVARGGGGGWRQNERGGGGWVGGWVGARQAK